MSSCSGWFMVICSEYTCWIRFSAFEFCFLVTYMALVRLLLFSDSSLPTVELLARFSEKRSCSLSLFLYLGLFVPTFVTKITEYLCSGGFFSSDKF